MLLTRLVVEGYVLLQALGDMFVVDNHIAIRSSHNDVEDVEQLARIATREAEQGLGLAHLDIAFHELLIGANSPCEKCLQLTIVHRFEDIYLAAA